MGSTFPFISMSLLHICLWSVIAAAAAKSHQSCPTLCDPIDGSPPGSAVPGILQARMLEWVAISFFSGLLLDTCSLELLCPLMEKEVAPHSGTLAWRIPQMEKPGRLQFMGSQRV